MTKCACATIRTFWSITNEWWRRVRTGRRMKEKGTVALVERTNILTSLSMALEAKATAFRPTAMRPALEALTDTVDVGSSISRLPRMDGMRAFAPRPSASDMPVIFLDLEGRGNRRTVRPEDGCRRYIESVLHALWNEEFERSSVTDAAQWPCGTATIEAKLARVRERGKLVGSCAHVPRTGL
jgi:hypothetical protein